MWHERSKGRWNEADWGGVTMLRVTMLRVIEAAGKRLQPRRDGDEVEGRQYTTSCRWYVRISAPRSTGATIIRVNAQGSARGAVLVRQAAQRETIEISGTDLSLCRVGNPTGGQAKRACRSCTAARAALRCVRIVCVCREAALCTKVESCLRCAESETVRVPGAGCSTARLVSARWGSDRPS